MKKFSFFIAVSLLISPLSFIFAETLLADTTPPNFISIATASSEETEANIVWTTDEPSYGYVEYGKTTSYGQATAKSALAKIDGSASITNLEPGTIYHYRVVAEDESGNIAYSEDRTLETAVELLIADNTPPEITSVSVSEITTHGAKISWTTNELADGLVEYGKTASYGQSTSFTSYYASGHSVSWANLEPGREYHFRILVKDESGNEMATPDEIFTTAEEVVAPPPPAPEPEPEPALPPEPPQVVFAISNVETSFVSTSSARIIWNTSEPATSQVFFGQGETYASSTNINSAMNASHQVSLAGLKSGTNYFYKVVSKNSSGETISKSGFEFNTLFEEKKLVKAPVISDVSVPSVGTSSATILWNTDVPAGGEIKYGPTTSYQNTDGGHTRLLTAHVHNLSGLSPDTTYNFLILVRDQYGNETIYENQTLRTLANPQNPAGNIANPPAAPEETVTDQTTIASEPSLGGGGDYSHTFTPTLLPPKLTKIEALDGQVMFVWDSKKNTPKTKIGSTKILANVVIVRNPVAHPPDPTFGKMVYKGNSGFFTDVNLKNGETYYYSVFLVNQFNSHSAAAQFEAVPKETKKETKLEIIPPFVQRSPIYIFPKELKIGDQNKHVEHLQVLLASAPSIYPPGLITGYFGNLTAAAIKKFQEKYKIPKTGVADNATLRKLEMLSSVEITKDKAQVFDSALFRDLKTGSWGGDVAILQQFLINAGAYPERVVSGYFGPLTKSALSKFQKDQNINPADGYFGEITKKRMLNIIRLRNVDN